jgi:hypothetical protein
MTQSLYPAIPVAAGAWSAPVGADRTKPWVERLSLGILIAILLYSVLGSAFTDASDTAQTDHVDPLNSWIWLGMLALSMPVLRRRWRGVMALLLSNWPLLLLFGYFTLSVSWALDPSASVRCSRSCSSRCSLFSSPGFAARRWCMLSSSRSAASPRRPTLFHGSLHPVTR